VVWHQADLLDGRSPGRLADEIGATHLVHLAWCAQPEEWATSVENSQWVLATEQLIQAFAGRGGRRVVGVGSCVEYDPRFGYCSERDTPLRPNTRYGACKCAAARLIDSVAAAGLSTAWARLFFVYGPAEAPARLVPTVIRGLLGGQAVQCTHGHQTRDYIHVADVADALVALLKSGVEGALNIGSGTPVRQRDVVLTLAEMLNGVEHIRFGARAPSPTDVPLTVADVRRRTTMLEWQPRHSLATGLADTIAWWRRQAATGAPVAENHRATSRRLD
jgi:nucleoside-diphosphate-sugar epimerase